MGGLKDIKKEREQVPDFMYIQRLEDYCQHIEKALQAIYNVDTVFLVGDVERPYNVKEAHDEMLKTAEKALYGDA